MCWTVLYVYAELGPFCTFKESLLARIISAKDSISLTIFSCRLVVMNMCREVALPIICWLGWECIC